MNLIPSTAIIVEEGRQRDDIDEVEQHIEDLADSIEALGLIHAPILERTGAVLRAGECRFRAMQLLHAQGRTFFHAGEQVPQDQIPFTRTHLLSEADLFELELEENIRRENLTPVQRACAIAKLHKLRVAEAEAKGISHTQEDTSREVAALEGKDPSTKHGNAVVAQALIIADYSDDPEVRKSKTFGDAYKLAQKKHTETFRGVMSALLDDEAPQVTLEELFTPKSEVATGEVAGSVPRDQDERIGRMRIIQGNCMDVMADFPGDSFDGILTDPPYGVGANTFGSQAKQEHEYVDDEETALAIMETIFKEGFRVCKDGAYLFMFCDIRKWPQLCEMAAGHGWGIWPKPVIWNKEGIGIAPYPKLGPRWTYEAILVAYKGEANQLGLWNDVLSFRPETGKEHAAQKPVELYKKLAISVWASKATILDPCAGSGTIFAMNPSLWNGYNRIVGIELGENHYNLCRDVINQIEDGYGKHK